MAGGDSRILAALVDVEDGLLSNTTVHITELTVMGDKEWPNLPFLCSTSENQALLYFDSQDSMRYCYINGQTLTVQKLSHKLPTIWGFGTLPLRISGRRMVVAGACPFSQDVTCIFTNGLPKFEKLGTLSGEKRRNTSTVLVRSRFVVGFGGSCAKYLDDLWVFDLKLHKSSSVRHDGVWHRGDALVPLILEENVLYLVGGSQSTSINAISLSKLAPLIEDQTIRSAFEAAIGIAPRRRPRRVTVQEKSTQLDGRSLRSTQASSRWEAIDSGSSRPVFRATVQLEKISQLEDTIGTLRKTVEDLHASLRARDAELQAKDGKIAELEQSLADNRAKLLSLRTTLAAANQELQDARVQAASHIAERDKAKGLATALQRDLALEKKAVAHLENSLEDSRKKLSKSDYQLQEVTAALISVTEERDQAKKQVEALQGTLAGEKETRRALRSKLQWKDGELAAARAKAEESDALRKQLSAIESQVQALQQNQITPGTLITRFAVADFVPPPFQQRWKLDGRAVKQLRKGMQTHQEGLPQRGFSHKAYREAFQAFLEEEFVQMVSIAGGAAPASVLRVRSIGQVVASLIPGQIIPPGSKIPGLARLPPLRPELKILDSAVSRTMCSTVSGPLSIRPEIRMYVPPSYKSFLCQLDGSDPLCVEATHSASLKIRRVVQAAKDIQLAGRIRTLDDALCFLQKMKEMGEIAYSHMEYLPLTARLMLYLPSCRQLEGENSPTSSPSPERPTRSSFSDMAIKLLSWAGKRFPLRFREVISTHD